MADISFGQYEPLTRRLHAILQDYADGVAIVKELIQNADDAGATEVKFLYDKRQNQNLRKGLLDPGMADCQGPALWVYNNATFSDQDFTNIEKLSGATKTEEVTKIGRFGLGFNAVYHLTDVPSFVSRNYLAIFDPHRTYLRQHIRDFNKPGIKLDTTKHQSYFEQYANQFKPYNGVFGCDLRTTQPATNYSGTLFRFPLRTEAQAIQSEICQKAYDEYEMNQLMSSLASALKDLLLFCQNVSEIEIYHLPAYAQNPSNIQIFKKVQKEPVKILRELLPNNTPTHTSVFADHHRLVRQDNILDRVASIMIGDSNQASAVEISTVIRMRITPNIQDHYWLVTSVMGKGNSYQIASHRKDQLPIGGVAIALKKSGEMFIPQPLVSSDIPTGKIYCFLPLPIESHLPVHINGYFAVMSNRCHLCQTIPGDKEDKRGLWNEALMTDAVQGAYIVALSDVLKLTKGDNKFFMDLWPRHTPDSPLEKALWHNFYKTVVASPAKLFADGSRMGSFKGARFMDLNFGCYEIRQMALSVLKCYIKRDEIVVDMPPKVVKAFQSAGLSRDLEYRTTSLQQFYCDFLPICHHVDAHTCDKLVQHAVMYNEKVAQLTKQHPCIPVSYHKLEVPQNLIHPYGRAAKLYGEGDQRFPVTRTEVEFRDPRMLGHLCRLGMKTDDISWDDIIDRAESIIHLKQPKAQAERAKHLVNEIAAKLRRTKRCQRTKSYSDTLSRIAFLPVLERPQHFVLPWRGDSFIGRLVAPCQIYPFRYRNLVGSVCPLASSYVFPTYIAWPEVEIFLGIRQQVTTELIVKQLLVMQHQTEQEEVGAGSMTTCIENMVHHLYKYFEEKCKDSVSKSEIQDRLKNVKCIWIGHQFVLPSQCSFELTLNARPYCYAVPENYYVNYKNFLRALGVKETMSNEDYIRVLATIHRELGKDGLSQEKLVQVKHIVSALCQSMSKFNVTPEGLQATVYLPDTNKYMKSVNDLCYNPSPFDWNRLDEEIPFVHGSISFHECSTLGVRTVALHELKKHRLSLGVSFGQTEDLTSRLSRILSSYPSGHEILKELVQNADDAGATEIHFIKDTRQHTTDNLFDPSWQHLQGPALCVYNNTPFTVADIKGIQKLGEGSKGQDPNKTGQYGIGFNSVYHITDTPTFMTCVDGQEELFVLDPHCKYVPEATKHEPGGRYRNLSELKNKFMGVFSCYDFGGKFPTQNATLFRFPLRTDEMANSSKLSDRPTTIKDLDALINIFKKEAKHALLFLNSLESIFFWEVTGDNECPRCIYSVSTELSSTGTSQAIFQRCEGCISHADR